MGTWLNGSQPCCMSGPISMLRASRLHSGLAGAWAVRPFSMSSSHGGGLGFGEVSTHDVGVGALVSSGLAPLRDAALRRVDLEQLAAQMHAALRHCFFFCKPEVQEAPPEHWQQISGFITEE